MNQAGQPVWGALPRRQRRLRRSSLSSPGALAGVVLSGVCGAGAIVAYVSLWPFF